jgi:hypothetical protein
VVRLRSLVPLMDTFDVPRPPCASWSPSAQGRLPLTKVGTVGAGPSGRLVTTRQLLATVWGPAYQTETHNLHVYVGQLRRKLEPDPARPRYLLTEAGMGYRLSDG